jgi:enterochelin esterase-like enzyme
MQQSKICFYIVTFVCFLSINNTVGQTIFKETAHDLQLSYGTVKRFYAESKWVDGRNIDVWLPDKFSADKKYAVIYMHDGQNLFDGSSVWNKKEWQVDETIGSLIEQHKIQDIIVVGIWNNGEKRHLEYFPQQVIDSIEEPQQKRLLELIPKQNALADNYLKFIVAELKPFIDSIFPTFTEQKRTFICGSSLGALISIYALCEYPEIFCGAACLSTHWIGTFENNKEIPKSINEYIKQNLPSPENHLIYFDYGTVGLDSNYHEYQKNIDSTMMQKGYNTDSWKTIKFEGDDHNENDWSKRFHIPLLFLFKIN